MRTVLMLVGLTLALLGLGATAAAQDRTAATPVKVVIVPAPDVLSVDGAVLYSAHCASCHGPNGRGNGRAARGLKAPATDLTRIADTDPDCLGHTLTVLMSGHQHHHATLAASDIDMPLWSAVLVDDSLRTLKIFNLARHVESLQASR